MSKHSERVQIGATYSSAATPYTAQTTTVGWVIRPVAACRSLRFHVLSTVDEWGHSHGRLLQWLFRPLCNYYDWTLRRTAP